MALAIWAVRERTRETRRQMSRRVELRSEERAPGQINQSEPACATRSEGQ